MGEDWRIELRTERPVKADKEERRHWRGKRVEGNASRVSALQKLLPGCHA